MSIIRLSEYATEKKSVKHLISKKMMFKIAAILIFLAIGYAQITSRLFSLVWPNVELISIFMYLILFLFCLFGIIAAALTRSALLRWPLALYFGGTSAIVASYQLTAGYHMTYDSFINMVNASGAFGEAWDQHASDILLGAFQSLMLALGIGLNPGHPGKRRGAYFAGMSLLTILVTSGILFMRGGEGGKGLPVSHIGAAYSNFYLYEKVTMQISPRKKVAITLDAPKYRGDIVMIIDESISGHYLDINSKDGMRSGLKDPPAGVNIHNLGLAASIANCSAAVNMTLRHGGTRAAYRQINETMPSIWAYAKKAGFETVYIDVPRTGRVLNNLMDKTELKDIDRWVQFDGVPIQRRDHAAADKLVAFINDDKQQFIYLNKIGAHFPVHDKFPDTFMKYKPALPRGSWLNTSDTGDRTGFSGSPESWIRYRNSYRDTLIWNVGAFFDRILPKANMKNATIIYTSDHGQNLHERGGEGVTTHCSPDPVPEEGLVPLVVIDAANSPYKTARWNWGDSVHAEFNRSSHFRIFPTMLEMMGYNQKQVTDLYGQNLFTRNADPFSFNYVFNARLGRDPEWKKIKLNDIAYPPKSDFSSKPR